MNTTQNAAPGSFLRVAVMLNIERNYARGILRGIERACFSHLLAGSGAPCSKWHLAVYPMAELQSSRAERKKMRDWQPDCILAEINSRSLAMFCKGFRKPVVQLMHPAAASGFPRVGLDDLAVGRQAADYFLQKGYRTFGYFELTNLGGFAAPWLRWNDLRRTGFQQKLDEFFRRMPGHAAAVPQVKIFSDTSPVSHSGLPKNNRDTESRIAEWLTSLPQRTAIFCGCDDWAVIMTRVAQSLQLRIPDHIAVLGVDDDNLFCHMVDPPLSSIVTGDERVGREAVKVVDTLLAGKPAPVDPILLAPLGVTERRSSNVRAVTDSDVSAALDYIKNHATENLSVKQIMPHLSVNRRTLELKFQRLLGRSPAEEIYRVRMESLKLLLRGDMSIRQIVQRMDYSSSQYLARTFKRETGMSLTEYRRKIIRGA